MTSATKHILTQIDPVTKSAFCELCNGVTIITQRKGGWLCSGYIRGFGQARQSNSRDKVIPIKSLRTEINIKTVQEEMSGIEAYFVGKIQSAKDRVLVAEELGDWYRLHQNNNWPIRDLWYEKYKRDELSKAAKSEMERRRGL